MRYQLENGQIAPVRRPSGTASGSPRELPQHSPGRRNAVAQVPAQQGPVAGRPGTLFVSNSPLPRPQPVGLGARPVGSPMPRGVRRGGAAVHPTSRAGSPGGGASSEEESTPRVSEEQYRAHLGGHHPGVRLPHGRL